jgi:hypothetical protein
MTLEEDAAEGDKAKQVEAAKHVERLQALRFESVFHNVMKFVFLGEDINRI